MIQFADDFLLLVRVHGVVIGGICDRVVRITGIVVRISVRVIKPSPKSKKEPVVMKAPWKETWPAEPTEPTETTKTEAAAKTEPALRDPSSATDKTTPAHGRTHVPAAPLRKGR